ncbi:hypothetical protein H0N98_03490, partial [Candidatus Micrarchaeota archaeon]|nr:hypothetical protein [Candidatus Micrarchaeota archaeon]
KEKLINGVGKESKERIVDVLVAKYDSDKSGDDWREKIVLAVGSLDYSNITDGTKKKAFDLLARATWDDDSGTRLRAAELVDRIGDKDTIKKVAEHWLPLLDIPQNGTMEDIYKSNYAVDIFERIRWEPAADKALELMKKRLAVQRVNGVGVEVIARSGSSKHEDAVIDAMTKDGDYNRPGFYAVKWFETLGKIGTYKSVKVLNEYIEKQKQEALSHLSSRELKDESKVKQAIERKKYSDFNWRSAEDAVKEIEGRISLAKPAEEKIKDAMEKKKVKV